MRLKRFIPLAVAGLLVPALPASAHISLFDIDFVTVEPSREQYDEVEGDITCDAGESFQVVVKVTDDTYAGKGRTQGTCTGELNQRWIVLITDEFGVGDACPERVRGRAHTKLNGVPHNNATRVLTHCAP